MTHALLETARLDNLWHRLAALAPDAAEWVLVAGFNSVLEPEPDGVEAHLAGDALDVRVHRECALRHTVSAKRTGRRCVRVYNIRVKTDVRRVVEGHALVSRVAGDRERVAAIGAGIRQRNHLVGNDPTVVAYARLHPDAHRVARARRKELFGARIFEAHRPAGGDGQVRGHIFDHDFLFAAKATADAWLDDPDALGGQSQHRR